MRSIGIGLVGLGTVGAGVFQALQQNDNLLSQRTGRRFEIRRIVLRNPAKNRPVAVPAELVTTKWQDLMTDPTISIIIELMGGTEETLSLFRAAIAAKKLIITGNKALLAEHGAEIFELAKSAGVPIFYEAAVAGGVPIIKSIREAFISNHFESIHGILNGTSNYILSRMTESGMELNQALNEAQTHGFAEADPSLDINGWDAAHKAILLTSLAYGLWIKTCNIEVEGIEHFSNLDIQFACQLGYRIKLLASICSGKNHEIEASVGPTLIPASHVLASVNGVFNAVLIQGDMVGEILFYGRGAGRAPTTSAVLGNLADAALTLTSSPIYSSFNSSYSFCGRIKKSGFYLSAFYLRLATDGQAGAFLQIINILGGAEIEIASFMQLEKRNSHPTCVVLMLKKTMAGVVRKAVRHIAALPCIKEKPVLLRVENFL